MDNHVRVNKINWWVYTDKLGIRRVQPLCPIHALRLYPSKYSYMHFDSQAILLKCEDCPKLHNIPRSYEQEERYVLDRIDAKIFKGMKVLNLDDEAIPVAKDDTVPKNSKYFITSQLMQSKTGLRLVVYAGERGKKEKAQIFIEPNIKRLAFDQKDLHPSEIFTSLEATFADGTKTSIKKK